MADPQDFGEDRVDSTDQFRMVGAWLPVPSPHTSGPDGELALHDADRLRLQGEGDVSWNEFVALVTQPEHRTSHATIYVERWVDAEEEGILAGRFIEHEVALQLVASMRVEYERLYDPEGEGEGERGADAAEG